MASNDAQATASRAGAVVLNQSVAQPVLVQSCPGRISVIIPTLNEASQLTATEPIPASRFNVEVIVVDGGSQDATADMARSKGWNVFQSQPGRARQMNAGAAVASGEILLFLHADTRLPPGFDTAARLILSRPGVVAGAFQLRIDTVRRGLRIIEKLANWRASRLGMPYGDQAIFLKADQFRAIGGFPDIPIMEDFELMRRLRRRGRVEIAPEAAVTSARRWEEIGLWRATWINQFCILAYCLAVPPRRIARWYQEARRSSVIAR